MNIESLPLYKSLTGLIIADILLAKSKGRLLGISNKDDKLRAEQEFTRERLAWDYDLSDCVADFEFTINSVNLPLFKTFVSTYGGYKKVVTEGKRSPRYTDAIKRSAAIERQLLHVSDEKLLKEVIEQLKESGSVDDLMLVVSQVDKREQLACVKDDLFDKLGILDSYEPSVGKFNVVEFVGLAVEVFVVASYRAHRDTLLGLNSGLKPLLIVKLMLAEKVSRLVEVCAIEKQSDLECLSAVSYRLGLGVDVFDCSKRCFGGMDSQQECLNSELENILNNLREK